MRNLYRFGAFTIYPLLLCLAFAVFLRQRNYRQTLQKKWHFIFFNSFCFLFIIALGLFLYFQQEDTIYSFDYAGHWVRNLEMRQLFFEQPTALFTRLFHSMNTHDYTYLPAFFLLPFTIFSTAYRTVGLGSLLYFVLPALLLLQILYFTHYPQQRFAPLFLCLGFYPLYFGLFFGEVDSAGLFWIALSISLLFLKPYAQIDKVDLGMINIVSILLLFLRRYYLYYVFAMYLLFLLRSIRFAFTHKDKIVHIFLNALWSGLPALLLLLFFFRDFVARCLGNNFAESYAMYNRAYKWLALCRFFSWPISLLCLGGGYSLLKKKRYETLIYLSLFMAIICGLFWQTQAFEYHHYHLILIPCLMLYSLGATFCQINSKKFLYILMVSLLLLQSLNIFTNFLPQQVPFLTHLRKQPKYYEQKKEIQAFSYTLAHLTKGEGIVAFLATGGVLFNYDLLQNANLPDLSSRPHLEPRLFDIRDGFPKDLSSIRYIVTSDPIQYIYPEAQHMLDIIATAIQKEPEIKKLYTPVQQTLLQGSKVTIYERTGEFTEETKAYFYRKMLEIYPDKASYFVDILH